MGDGFGVFLTGPFGGASIGKNFAVGDDDGLAAIFIHQLLEVFLDKLFIIDDFHDSFGTIYFHGN